MLEVLIDLSTGYGFNNKELRMYVKCLVVRECDLHLNHHTGEEICRHITLQQEGF